MDRGADVRQIATRFHPSPRTRASSACSACSRPRGLTSGAVALKALVKEKAEPGLWLVDVPEPQAGPGDVLIKVLRTGICGTDLHIRNWDGWAQQAITTPLVLGHEFVGEVVETGRDVADINVGDRVSGEGHLVCGKCRNCLAGPVTSAVPRSASASAATARSPSTSCCPPPTCGCTASRSTSMSPRSSTRSATPSTRPCRSRW